MHHNYAAPSTLSQALRRRWPKGQQIIAEAIGVDPAEIWPSRYANSTRPAASSDIGEHLQSDGE